jgi:hypothetical protein
VAILKHEIQIVLINTMSSEGLGVSPWGAVSIPEYSAWSGGMISEWWSVRGMEGGKQDRIWEQRTVGNFVRQSE